MSIHQKYQLGQPVQIAADNQNEELTAYKNQRFIISGAHLSEPGEHPDDQRRDILYTLGDGSSKAPDVFLYDSEIEPATKTLQEQYDDGSIITVYENDVTNDETNHKVAVLLKDIAQIHGITLRDIADVDWDVVYDMKEHIHQGLTALGVKIKNEPNV